MDATTESTPLQRGAVRTACLFVAIGLWMMLVNRALSRLPMLAHLFTPPAPAPYSYGPNESWAVFSLIALFPAMVVAGDVAGTALARALGGRVLALAASTDLLLATAAKLLLLGPIVLGDTYGAPATEGFRGMYLLLASAHIAHARRTAAKVVWVLVALLFIWVGLTLPSVYPPAFPGGYAACALVAMLVDARLTGQGSRPAERSWFALLPVLVASFAIVAVSFTLLDTGLVLGVNVVPFMQRFSAGDVPAMEKAAQHVLSIRPGEPVASVFMADVRIKQGRWDEGEALARPYASDSWQGGEVGRLARRLVSEVGRMRALEKKHGAGTLALAKAVEAGEGRAAGAKPTANDDAVFARPLFARSKDPAAKTELDRVDALIRKQIEAATPKPSPSPVPSPSASPSPRG